MRNIHDSSLLWGDDLDDPSSFTIGKLSPNPQASLLLSLLKEENYNKNLHETKYDFNFYEIILRDFCILDNFSFPVEIERGKYEYKFKLTNVKADRLTSLGTQMKWRIQEGDGEAYYEIGVMDNGKLRGLCLSEIYHSIDCLIQICEIIFASIESVYILQISKAEEPKKKYIGEVKISFKSNFKNGINRRIFLLGEHSVGKTTLVGVLTKSQPDDGQGQSRMGCFKHPHEVKSGQTSSLSLHMIGFTENKKILNYTNCSSIKEIYEKSHVSISITDSCGQPQFFETTIKGLTGTYPHVIFILINASFYQTFNNNLLKLAFSWSIPLIFLLTHCDISNETTVMSSIEFLGTQISEISSRSLKFISDIKDVDDLVFFPCNQEIPILPISNVTCQNLNILNEILYKIANENMEINPLIDESNVQFSIHNIKELDDNDFVVSGILISGTLNMQDKLYFGPVKNQFYEASVKLLKRFQVDCKQLLPNQIASVVLKSSLPFKIKTKKGLYLLSHPGNLYQKFGAILFEDNKKVMEKLNFPLKLVLANIRCSAIISDVSSESTETDSKKVSVAVELLNKHYYIPTGSRLVLKNKNDLFVGAVIHRIFC